MAKHLPLEEQFHALADRATPAGSARAASNEAATRPAMPLREDLRSFADALRAASLETPGEEEVRGARWIQEANLADTKALWATIRPRLQRDLERAAWIDGQLQQMFKAFDAGKQEQARQIVWALCRAKLGTLR